MKQLFFFLSKTDQDIIRHCPMSAQNNQVSLGIFVLFTGLFAFVSGSFAVSMAFIKTGADGKPLPLDDTAIVISCLVGCLYSLTIMAIDREIVSSQSKAMTLFRFPLAIMIGLVISVPIELQLMDARIEKQLRQAHIDENIQNRKKRSDSVVKAFQDEQAKIEKEINEERTDVRQMEKDLDAEEVGRQLPGRTGVSGRGPAYRQLLENYKTAQTRLANANLKMEKLNAQKDSILNIADSLFKDDSPGQTYDFLARYQAFNELVKEDKEGSAGKMKWGLTLLFIFIELMPALMKIFLRKDEYNTLLETRRRLNIQMAHAIAREGMQAMENNVENALDNPMYMKDIRNNIQR